MNVLPLVNKALALYQWQNDLPRAEELCKEALEIDPECDAAVATLAQLSLQQGKLDQAIEYFGRHASIARSEPELEQSVTFENVSVARIRLLYLY
jgi:import receptor subunit TOM70